MILGNIAHCEYFDFSNKNFDACLAFMKSAINEKVENGQIKPINGSCNAYFQKYKTTEISSKKLESHLKNYDIQFVVEGKEELLVYPQWKLLSDDKFDNTKDIGFYKYPVDEVTKVTLKKGDFAIVDPNDAHMPGVMVKKPELVKKIVIKVPTENK